MDRWKSMRTATYGEKPGKVLKVKRFSPDAKLPTRATPGSGGVDLYATQDYKIAPGAIVGIDTYIGVEFPKGCSGLLMVRSSYGKDMVILGGGTALIDEDYRGHIWASLMNLGVNPKDIKKGDRIAQMVVVEVPQYEIVETDELSETERGTGGFGSTGR